MPCGPACQNYAPTQHTLLSEKAGAAPEVTLRSCMQGSVHLPIGRDTRSPKRVSIHLPHKMYIDKKLLSIELVLLQKIKYLSTIDAQDTCTVVAFLLLNLQDHQKNILLYHQQDKQITKDNYLHIWSWLVI